MKPNPKNKKRKRDEAVVRAATLELAKAIKAFSKGRDEWLASNEGRRCCVGTASGEYLRNRLELAFAAGSNWESQQRKGPA